MKRQICILALLFLLLPIVGNAANEYVADTGNLLTESEKSGLSAHLCDISEKSGVDVVFLTVPGLHGVAPKEIADTYYDSNGYRNSGILLLVSMPERMIYTSTAGSCIKTFDRNALNRLENAVIASLRENDPYGAGCAYANICREILEGEGTPVWKTVLICFAIGAGVALIVVVILACQLKSVRKKNQASDYVLPGSLNLTQCLDLYLYQTTTRRAKPKNNTGSGGGGRKSHGGRGRSF